ncbi:MAG: ABC transporter permease [Candidatus Zixiibacteriota bacterium]
MKFVRFWAVLRKEYRQFFRDRVTAAVIFAIPAIQLLLFGYAINFEVEHLPTAVLDYAECAESRAITRDFVNSQYFDIQYYVSNYEELTDLIDSGRVKAGIVFPADLKRRLKAGKPASAAVVFDASDPITARSAISSAQAIGMYRSIQILGRAYGSSEMPLEIRTRAWYNPEMISANFMIPGLIGVIMQLVTMMLTAMAIVRERERGTLEQLLVSPVNRLELILGKLVPYVVLGYIDITMALLISRYVFGVSIVGNIFALYALAFLFLASTLGFGLLISTIAKTQQQAMQMSFFIFLPSILLSGFFFPVAAMPDIIKPVSYVIPLTYFLDICRGIMLKGQSFSHLVKQTVVLAVMGALILGLAVSRMRKRVS